MDKLMIDLLCCFFDTAFLISSVERYNGPPSPFICCTERKPSSCVSIKRKARCFFLYERRQYPSFRATWIPHYFWKYTFIILFRVYIFPDELSQGSHWQQSFVRITLVIACGLCNASDSGQAITRVENQCSNLYFSR